VKTTLWCLITVSSITFCDVKTQAQDTNTSYKIRYKDVIDSVHLDWLGFSNADPVAHHFTDERSMLIAGLLDVYTNTNTPNFNRCTCAYYLGELRAAEAADALAATISLELDPRHVVIRGLYLAAYDPALNALIKIGGPAIRSLIKNLAESDDAKIGEFSLKALCHIEGDKDVVQFRLQKALAAQKDSQKQIRLESALKKLADMSY
jgi:hypothetical protein